LPNVEGVYYQSIGSKLNKAGSGRFPLNFSYHLVNAFDGANDGLVGENSFKWGEEYNFLTVKGKRGISHGDMIDLNRENFDGFDVREFYVQLVAKLKSMGF
jgi:triacylglycerol lipase